MDILNLDTAAAETDLASLRADADALVPMSLPPLPAHEALADLVTRVTGVEASIEESEGSVTVPVNVGEARGALRSSSA